MIRFFAATHCGMGVPPVILVRARSGRRCHNASPTAHADSTESRDLSIGFPACLLSSGSLSTDSPVRQARQAGCLCYFARRHFASDAPSKQGSIDLDLTRSEWRLRNRRKCWPDVLPLKRGRGDLTPNKITQKIKVFWTCDRSELIIKMLGDETRNSIEAMVRRQLVSKSFSCCPPGWVVRRCRPRRWSGIPRQFYRTPQKRSQPHHGFRIYRRMRDGDDRLLERKTR